MCGRFTLRTNWTQIARVFQLEQWDELRPRYNIAPESMIACVRLNPETGRRECVSLRWGLIPSWSKDATIARKLINARSETVAEKPSFRSAFRARRCLVLADGFYEWLREGKKKQPYYIRLEPDQPFAFAGLWERWSREGVDVQTCTILTTDANERLQAVHNRMPVILDPKDAADWLDPAAGRADELMVPYPSDAMTLFPVSDIVNRATFDAPECIQPA
jgi:putative SOS response-associated peptidase YedK